MTHLDVKVVIAPLLEPWIEGRVKFITRLLLNLQQERQAYIKSKLHQLTKLISLEQEIPNENA